MEIQGKIQKVTQTSGVSDKGRSWVRWTFLINDKKYSTFDEVLGTSFKVGENVEITGEQDGQFFNMKGMKRIEAPLQQESNTIDNSETPLDSNLVVDLLRQILAELKKNGNTAE